MLATLLSYKWAALSFFIALLPTFGWLYVLFSDKKDRKAKTALIFFGGVATVIPLIVIYGTFRDYPEFDVTRIIPTHIPIVAIGTLIFLSMHALLEEVFKQAFLRITDRRYLIIETVNDSVTFGMLAGLGFSFAENIYPYFYRLLTSGRYNELVGNVLVRSLFTTAMHLAVSGLFGYFYGVAKFAIDFRDESKWSGQRMPLVRLISFLFNIPMAQAYREAKILQGLMIGWGIHTTYNFLVEYGLTYLALPLVVASFTYLILLLRNKSGQLVLTNALDEGAATDMKQKDEAVLLELLGMWFNEKRYVDVMHICERLLKRDPGNNVVKLFQARALDKLQGNDPYRQVINAMTNKNTGDVDQSRIDTWIAEQKKKGVALPTNVQSMPEFQEFLKQEKAKRAQEATFKIEGV